MTFKLKHWVFFILLVAVDQVSKLLAQFQGLVVLNPGVSFGLLFQVPHLVLSSLLVLVLVVGMFLWQKYLPKAKWAAIWFFAGGISNVVDRFLVGAVRDWLHIPLLGNKNNLADWFIFIAIMVLMVSFLQKEPKNV